MISNFFSKSKLGLSANKISTSLTQIFTHKKLDEDLLEKLEDVLLLSDMGGEITSEIITHLRAQKFSKNIDEAEIKNFLAAEIIKVLKPCEKPLALDESTKPQIIIFNGVNGAGKTTTIAKIAANLKNQNKKVLIAACDTFRAAAAEQLEIWAKKIGCEIMMPQKEGEDPASVAYRAFDFAKKNGHDVVLIDTAGRLQNKQNLMDELKKINSVLKKIDASAPHENLLILDATIGQNAKAQMEVFNQIVGITGIIITKLDGSAKGGIVVSIAKKFVKPIYAIGVGEKAEDLQEFNAEIFVRNFLNHSAAN
ncbi:MAG: signal recognition particle-docking protein FtsY [Proteobacteria bacterium]|nr:signal recognition particle-docking protein FtsY [Pseudomonadota bacterium]